MVSILYAQAALFCDVILGLILLRTRAYANYSRTGRKFTFLLICSILFSLIDSIWGFSACGCFPALTKNLKFFSYCFHIASSITACVWYVFCLYYLGEKLRIYTTLKIIPVVLLFIELLIIFFNEKSNTVFYITPENEYITLPLRKVIFFLQFTNFIMMLIFSVISAIQEKDNERRIYPANAIVFSLVPLLTGIGQFVAQDAPIYSFGFTLSCFTIYAFIITHENNILMVRYHKQKQEEEFNNRLKRELSVMYSISGFYDVIGIIDLSEDTMLIINITDYFNKYIPDNKTTVTEAEFSEVLRKIIVPDNYDAFITSVRKDLVSGSVLSGQRVSFEFTACENGEEKHFRMFFALDKGNSNNIILAIANVDNEYILIKEIEEQKHFIKNLQIQNEMVNAIASIDGLTGLMNKLAFIEKVERYLAENDSENCALIFFDMDHFKSINDTFGHAKGDDALREMADKLKKIFGNDEMMARMGGDEFCIFLPLISLKLVTERIQEMNKQLYAEYKEENKKVKTSVSIGCAYSFTKGHNYVELHSVADKAMYQIKENGRNNKLIMEI